MAVDWTTTGEFQEVWLVWIANTLPVSKYTPGLPAGDYGFLGSVFNFHEDPARSPTVPIFSGTVAPSGEYTVKLRMGVQKSYLESVKTDPSGYFEFRGWYPVRSDYAVDIWDITGLHYLGEFNLNPPAEHEWTGDPRRYDTRVM